ncbi:hypothetical protein HAX54_017730 [Datura stramonium]|uniref:RRM domain-containing protein n=1 Tax=Datura stramonium TaxID=4076 RepID=A0ABS8S0Q4_DATST|nr:hypothetical protein [Datura stramonium]
MIPVLDYSSSYAKGKKKNAFLQNHALNFPCPEFQIEVQTKKSVEGGAAPIFFYPKVLLNCLCFGEIYFLLLMETLFKEYAAFEHKVNRTVYIDNLSPLAKESVVKAALDQFGNVIQVKLIRTYLELKNMGRAALVEMQNADEAKAIISEIRNTPFMISGMPRPVRACSAVAEMFDDRPKKPGRKIMCRWLKYSDPDFEVAMKMKRIVRNHAKEANFLLKRQLEEEEQLAKEQSESLNAIYDKYELIERVFINGTAMRLAERYKMPTDVQP